MTTPSELLTRAADLIRDTAAAATPGPWQQNRGVIWPQAGGMSVIDDGGYTSPEDGAWIALLNPAVAPALEAWLRNSAREYAKLEHLTVSVNPEDPPIYFAAAVLGLENTPEETVLPADQFDALADSLDTPDAAPHLTDVIQRPRRFQQVPEEEATDA